MKKIIGLIGRRFHFIFMLVLSALPAGLAGTAQAAEAEQAAAAAPTAARRISSCRSWTTPSWPAFGGLSGHTLLLAGLVISGLGLAFGLVMFAQMRGGPYTGRCWKSPS